MNTFTLYLKLLISSKTIHAVNSHTEQQTIKVHNCLVCSLLVGTNFLRVWLVMDVVDCTKNAILERIIVIILNVDAASGALNALGSWDELTGFQKVILSVMHSNTLSSLYL